VTLGRREFLGALALPAAAGPLGCANVLREDALARAAELADDARDPALVARDEDYWRAAQQAFTVDRSMINLNNGGVCPAPRGVQEAHKRHLDHGHLAPAYVLWRLQDPQKEGSRVGLARLFGCDPEEVAITRNASESLENVQLGLDLARGDEILTSTQDYPRMLTTWRQRERREGLVLRQVRIPVATDDPAEIVRAFESGVTARTRVLHMCHVVNLTGQILPVKEVVALARARGIAVIVDGAHSFAHLDFKHAELDCDYYGTSLHKFLHAPHGTGMLYVRRSKIRGLWPLMPAEEKQDDDIRKFEEIGTHPVANRLAIAEALIFHETLGPRRKQERLLYLRDVWARRLLEHPRVRLHTSLKPGRATGVANFEIEGLDPNALMDHLWQRQRIFTVAIVHPEFRGLRISPAVYTTLNELERFCEAVERVLRDGLPG